MLFYYVQSSVVHAANSLVWDSYGEFQDAELGTVCFSYIIESTMTKKKYYKLKINSSTKNRSCCIFFIIEL